MSLTNRRWLSLLLLFSWLAVDAQAQRTAGISRGAGTSGTDFITLTRDLSDKAQDGWNALQNQRLDVPPELYMTVGAFAGAALALSQVAADSRGDAAIRSGVTRLGTLAQEIDPQVGGVRIQVFRDAWYAVQLNLSQLSANLNLSYRAPRRPGGARGSSRTAATASGGWFRWQGRVDGSDHIILQGDTVSIRHLQNNPITGATYELSGPLPGVAATLRLNKLQGRGRVEIVNQPAAWNGYSCTVLVDDPDGGADLYRFEIVW
jgi:hypothetical protein